MLGSSIGAESVPRATAQHIRALRPEGRVVRCTTDEAELTLPRIPASYLRVGDQIRTGSSESPVVEFVAAHAHFRHGARQLYLCRIGYTTQPKTDKRNEHFVRAEVQGGSLGVRSLHIPIAAIRDYFYSSTRRSDEARAPTLYEALSAAPTASFADLRLCYRIRRVEINAQGCRDELQSIERAFNLLSNPELRSCCDALMLDKDAPALFPYGGFGQCLTSGDLAGNGETFFVRHLLSYVPDRVQRSFRAPLRRIDFFNGYAVYRDCRRKVEVFIDPCLLPLDWDPTWNQWKHLMGGKFGIAGTFVETGKYRFRKGAWTLARWQTAIPSRVSLTLPSDAGDVVDAARRAYQRFGEYHDAIRSIQDRLQREPISEDEASELCRKAGIPLDFDIAELCWQPDYDRYYYQQLRGRSRQMHLFRSEYIFQLARTIVAEIPQVGHATYVFAKPNDLREFIGRYAQITRDDIRKNRGNVAGQLGFIGRVMHGSNRRNWTRGLRSRIGEA